MVFAIIIILVISWIIIFMVAACTAGKGSKVALFVGKIFVVRTQPQKPRIFPHPGIEILCSRTKEELI